MTSVCVRMSINFCVYSMLIGTVTFVASFVHPTLSFHKNPTNSFNLFSCQLGWCINSRHGIVCVRMSILYALLIRTVTVHNWSH